MNGHLSALAVTSHTRGFSNPFTMVLASHRKNVASRHWLGFPTGCCSEAGGGTVGAVSAPVLMDALVDPIVPWYTGVSQWIHLPSNHISWNIPDLSSQGTPHSLNQKLHTPHPLCCLYTCQSHRSIITWKAYWCSRPNCCYTPLHLAEPLP